MNTTSAFASGFLSGRTAKIIAAIGVVGCLAFGGFTVAVTGAGAALSAQPLNAISVNHANKGDRLPLALKRTPSSPDRIDLVTPAGRVRIGIQPRCRTSACAYLWALYLVKLPL